MATLQSSFIVVDIIIFRTG